MVGKGQGLPEGYQAVLAHEGPIPCVQPQVVLQRGVGRKLGPTLLEGEGLLIKVFCHLWYCIPGEAGRTLANSAAETPLHPTAGPPAHQRH